MDATASSILSELSTISLQAPRSAPMEETLNPETAESDQRLMERYRAGEAAAFNELYRRFRAPLRRFVAKLSAGPDEADEIVQEVWLAVIRGARSYRPAAKFSTFLFSIAHRRLQDHWRSSHRRSHLIAAADVPPDPEQIASARRARRLPMRRLAYGIAATLPATLGIAAGLRSVADARRHSHSEMPTARVPEGPKNPAESYLSNARLDSASGERRDHAQALVIRVIKRVGLQRREAGFLQEASALSPLGAGAACGTASRIDLNAPEALAALRAARPGDYVTVMRIIAGLTRHPELDVPRWISATFHAGNVSYFPIWMTTLPPKRRLGFCLQDARYTAVVTITPNGARLSLTDYRRNPRAPGR